MRVEVDEPEEGSIAHYGVKGMRWGVRRAQRKAVGKSISETHQRTGSGVVLGPSRAERDPARARHKERVSLAKQKTPLSAAQKKQLGNKKDIFKDAKLAYQTTTPVRGAAAASVWLGTLPPIALGALVLRDKSKGRRETLRILEAKGQAPIPRR